MDTRVDHWSEEEHGRCGAVVRAAGAVLRDPSAELAEGHGEDAIVVALFFEVFVEGVDGAGELLDEVGVASVGAALPCVRVEAAHRDVVDARFEAPLGSWTRPSRVAEQVVNPGTGQVVAGRLLCGCVHLRPAHRARCG